MDSLISDVIAPLLDKLSPARRKIILRKIVTHLRGTNQQRIKAQQNTDGTPFAPRKLTTEFKGLRNKRGPMFSKLRLNKHLRSQVSTNEALLGFGGRTGVIARQHQEGLTDNSSGNAIPTQKRQLLGITPGDEQAILEIVFQFLSEN